MRYNLNGSLIYNATDGTLTLPDEDAPDSQLSVTASALLNFFLLNRGVLSREEILKKVWDDNGLTSSNSNLNQYLSMLRKTFRHYRIDNVILTISRGHLQLNPDLTVERLDAEPQLPAPAPVTEKSASPDNQQQVFKVSSRPSGACWYMASAALLLIALLMVVVSFVEDGSGQSVSLTRADYGECVLLESKEMQRSGSVSEKIKNFNAVRQRLKLDCRPDERFVFFYGDKLQTNGLGRVFLARCARTKDNPFSYCASYFYYSWKAS